jgi:predicted peptidase
VSLRSILAVLALVAAGQQLTAAAQNVKPDNVQTPQHYTGRVTREVKLDYLLFLPKGCEAQSAKKWPLILFLHGAGERGTNLWQVAVHGPPKIVREKPDFPFIVVSPQCPSGRLWSDEELLGLLDDVTAKYAVDPSRVYLTGLSMGGFGTWSLGLSKPERFAAIAPICGGGDALKVLLAEPKKAAAIRSLPVWAFHGAKDPVVKLEESQRMVDALQKAGCKEVQLTIYPEAQHDSWTETYSNPKFYEWLLQHQRKAVAQ